MNKSLLIVIGVIIGLTTATVMVGSLAIEENEFQVNEEIVSDVTWENEQRDYDNESVIIKNDQNLTIINSHINFTN